MNETEYKIYDPKIKCGECRYHHIDHDGDWFCNNPDSAYYCDWTEYDDYCEDGKERTL